MFITGAKQQGSDKAVLCAVNKTFCLAPCLDLAAGSWVLACLYHPLPAIRLLPSLPYTILLAALYKTTLSPAAPGSTDFPPLLFCWFVELGRRR